MPQNLGDAGLGLRIVCLSDTHLRDVAVPPGDVLVHAGDFTMGGSLREIERFAAWIGALPHRYKIVIAGNHDFGFERHPHEARDRLDGVTYLEDQGVEVEGLRIWGSPWQPRFRDWAFNLDRGAPLREKWERIPPGTDLLVTHGPPAGILDRTVSGQEVGCADLRDVVFGIRPRLHVFGHIHEGFGVLERDGTTFANASICTVGYEPRNPCLVFDL